jgi:hypothetical protein
MSFYHVKLKRQDSAQNLHLSKLSKINSRKFSVFPRQKSLYNNRKLLKKNILPNISTLGKNELKSNIIFDESSNENLIISDLHKENQMTRKLSFKKIMAKPINCNIKKYLLKINDNNNNEKKDHNNIWDNTLEKDDINLKKITNYNSLSPKNYPLLNRFSKKYENYNKVKSLFKHTSLSPTINNARNYISFKNLNFCNKIEIPKIPFYINEKRMSKNEIKEDKKEKEIKKMEIQTKDFDESNSFLNEIKDIISVCITPIKNEGETSNN